MTFRLGLTGSIGMGKSTTAALFADEGVPVWDADATVRKLYAPGGGATKIVAALFPDVIEGGAVSRPKLREKIADDPAALDRLQAAVHPLVAQDRAAFLQNRTEDIVLLDIPLLYETGAETGCDAVVVVTAPPEVQRTRVLARGEMTPAEFELILSRQMPDAEKRARADYVIETTTPDAARLAVRAICADIRRKLAHA
jgi:dephospho-CoA kinase